jgi:hypothetical protein
MIHSTGVTPVRTWAAVVAFGWGDNLVTVGAGYPPPPVATSATMESHVLGSCA